MRKRSGMGSDSTYEFRGTRRKPVRGSQELGLPEPDMTTVSGLLRQLDSARRIQHSTGLRRGGTCEGLDPVPSSRLHTQWFERGPRCGNAAGESRHGVEDLPVNPCSVTLTCLSCRARRKYLRAMHTLRTTLVAVSVRTIRKAEAMIRTCWWCDRGADTSFCCLLDWVTERSGAETDYVMSEPARCPSCNAPVLEDTLVEWKRRW